MKAITKQTILTYNGRGLLNGVSYKVVRIGKINVTLEPIYTEKLIGLPTFRQPFNIMLADLNEAISEGIYSIN